MSAAVKRLREAAGISNNELSRLIGMEQVTAWRYEKYREPGYQIVQEIERVLDLAPGTLFAVAGYAPTLAAEDAVRMDGTLTEAQRDSVLAAIARAKGLRRPKTHQVDSAAFVYGDPELPSSDQDAIAQLIQSHRYVNASKVQGSRR